jgi:molybdopterin-containing oxidoreductase family iron-sulfur binding subunit
VTQLTRRQFLGILAGVGAMAILSQRVVEAASRTQSPDAKPALTMPAVKRPSPAKKADGADAPPVPGARFGLVIDAGACIGCRRCAYACKTENNIPDSITPPWIEVFQLDNSVDITGHPSLEVLNTGETTSYTKSPEPGKWYLAAQCNHCDNAPCTHVCPTGATYKTPDGYVLMDYDRCIGCRFCVVACPYNARRFNWVQPKLDSANPNVPVRPVGVVEKCTFCVHRTRKGQLPRCVEVCPVGARHFGDMNDPNSEISRILRETPNFRLLEDLNTQPNIHYITRGKKYTG